jgi:hypothetical protein
VSDALSCNVDCCGNVEQDSSRCAQVTPATPGSQNGHSQAGLVTGETEEKQGAQMRADVVTHDQIRRFAQTDENSKCSSFFCCRFTQSIGSFVKRTRSTFLYILGKGGNDRVINSPQSVVSPSPAAHNNRHYGAHSFIYKGDSIFKLSSLHCSSRINESFRCGTRNGVVPKRWVQCKHKDLKIKF